MGQLKSKQNSVHLMLRAPWVARLHFVLIVIFVIVIIIFVMAIVVIFSGRIINSQSLEDAIAGYTTKKYTFKNTPL